MKINDYTAFRYGMVAGAVLLVSVVAANDLEPPATQLAREILVKFHTACPATDRAVHMASYGCTVTGRCGRTQVLRVQITSNRSSREVLAELAHDESVVYAEHNHVVWANFVPNDPLYPYQWNLQATAMGGINAEPAWDIHTGDPNVIVAVLDTGVAYENFDGFRGAPDLAGTHFVPGYDFIEDDAHPNDDHGHGTHVAGTIAQSTHNERGVAGVAFGCSLMPVKVLDVNGLGDHFTIAQGVRYAVDHGAHVINLSLGAPGNSQTLRDALAYAYRHDVTVVCSAGNEFLRGNPAIYPAAYDAYCLAVGASTLGQARAVYSGTGAFVDLVAPGGDVFSDDNDDSYGDGILQETFSMDPRDFAFWFFQGTSMAAPHVSGAAALLYSRGLRTPDAVRATLEQTAVDLGPKGYDEDFGWGLLDLGTAMSHDAIGVQPTPGIVVRTGSLLDE